MATNFAPYQDTPELVRAMSPPAQSPRIASPRASIDRTRSTNIGTGALTSPNAQSYQQSNSSYFPPTNANQERVPWSSNTGFGNSGSRGDIDVFETRLGMRMDHEACLAYLLLPPAGGVLLLVLEHRSDYVRFHAWQSSLLFAFIFVVHIIFSWSSVISWILFVGDLGLIGLLTWHAYKDAETLDRYEVPFFGPLASSILDDE
ncbi:hypothetical protein BDV96DRAFT_176738 [Lophiotrema nucula]|uniref:Uncharacterized protein n=1 Tax=Lophiotrema nucula TaxID=690887 RepID=A0A6A5YY61_9PLEO|nr:hypothetical protein BDV96DRAFT_176738 [Lophiotrema nucula]